jgi:hypothetical protein
VDTRRSSGARLCCGSGIASHYEHQSAVRDAHRITDYSHVALTAPSAEDGKLLQAVRNGKEILADGLAHETSRLISFTLTPSPTMSREDLIKLAAEYRELLQARGFSSQHIPDTSYRIDPLNVDDREMLLRHAMWACEHIPEQVDRLGGHQRCMRWIGTIQGTLTAYGFLTVAEARARFSEFKI